MVVPVPKTCVIVIDTFILKKYLLVTFFCHNVTQHFLCLWINSENVHIKKEKKKENVDRFIEVVVVTYISRWMGLLGYG